MRTEGVRGTEDRGRRTGECPPRGGLSKGHGKLTGWHSYHCKRCGSRWEARRRYMGCAVCNEKVDAYNRAQPRGYPLAPPVAMYGCLITEWRPRGKP